MEGRIDNLGRPVVEVTISGRRGDITCPAIIDTGFDGEICLPVEVAVQLGLELAGIQSVMLADGTIKKELVFIGKVSLGKREEEARIILTEARDTLLGTGLLWDSKLEIDFSQFTVEIKQ